MYSSLYPNPSYRKRTSPNPYAKEAQLFLPMEGMARGAAVRKKRRRVWDIGEVLEAGGWDWTSGWTR